MKRTACVDHTTSNDSEDSRLKKSKGKRHKDFIEGSGEEKAEYISMNAKRLRDAPHEMLTDTERLRELARKKHRDVVDGFGEEKAESVGSKRKRNRFFEEWLTDSEDELNTQGSGERNDSSVSHASQTRGQYDKTMMKMFERQGLDTKVRLGKNSTGIKEPIQMPWQKGRAGFGSKANEFSQHDFDSSWDSTLEKKTVEELPLWIKSANNDVRNRILTLLSSDEQLIVVSEIKETIDDETRYCNPDLLRKMLSAKSVFDVLSDRELVEARARANPYETIKCGFFQNRAAMKAANLDAVFGWLFTGEKENEKLLLKHPVELNEDGTLKKGINIDRNEPLFYFADVCAGPGGFSEYALWRKGFYNAKGFGFTLKGKDDFKLERFTAASPTYFEPFYGEHGDGDVTKPENIKSFEKFVRNATGNGVQLMMADGGFSVSGKENIQEILSKRLYLCQFLVALSVVCEHGVFFCKLFDIFTPFSIGLIYLMYIAFDRISLHKPNTSRPANSERYIICEGLRKREAEIVKNYFTEINNKLETFKRNKSREDIYEILPQEVIADDADFFHYVKDHNDSFLKRQTLYLEKYKTFAKDPGKIDLDQGKLRDDCMEYWKLPKVERRSMDQRRTSMSESLRRLCKEETIEMEQLRKSRPQFSLKDAKDVEVKGMKYEVLRLCVLSGRNERCSPKILFSNGIGEVFIQNNENVDGVAKMDPAPRVPRNSLLLVQETEIEKMSSKSNEKNIIPRKRYALRILDAAVIDGDDVSRLTLEERIKAARKMCVAVRLHELTQEAYPIFTAKFFKLEELSDLRSSFERACYKGEEVIYFKESDELVFRCRGMWVVYLLKASWRLFWSKTNQNCYLFNMERLCSYLCGGKEETPSFKKFGNLNCFTTFWDIISLPKDPEKARVRQWDWTRNTVDDKDYGPAAILEKEEHSSEKPTLQSLQKIAEIQKRNCEIQSGKNVMWVTQ